MHEVFKRIIILQFWKNELRKAYHLKKCIVSPALLQKKISIFETITSLIIIIYYQNITFVPDHLLLLSLYTKHYRKDF